MLYQGLIDGSKTYAWGESAIAAVVAIVLVFTVLLIIIGITHLVFKGLGYLDLKKQIDEEKNKNNISSNENTSEVCSFDENDEDMVAAVLVATIDYQNEVKSDVKLVSVKEIK